MKLLEQLSDEEVMHFIGNAKGNPDENMLRDLEEMKQKVLSCSTPRYVMRELPLQNHQLQGVDLKLQGKDIQRLLKECHSCILLAVTLGNQIDAEMKRLQLKDMGKAFMFDCCASAAIEHVCDELQLGFEECYHKRGQYITDRYSCGYGDLPLTIQQDFLKVLDASKRAGIYANENYVLHPMKSVTAIIGIADTIQPAILRGCAYCSLKETCVYKKGGVTCGK